MFHRKKPGRWLWLVNAALLAIFGWALTEKTNLTIEVADGECVAFAPDRESRVACPGLAGGDIGLYYRSAAGSDGAGLDIWRRLVPRSSWSHFSVTIPNEEQVLSDSFDDGRLTNWQIAEGRWQVALGELRPVSPTASIQQQAPGNGSLTVQAELRRAYDDAGILLLEPNGEDGWLFVVSSHSRRGTWWRWQSGQPDSALTGIPFQKGFLAQSQSFLRQLLYTHQVTLLILAAGWILVSSLRTAKLPYRIVDRLRFPKEPRNIGLTVVAAITLLVFAITTFFAKDLLEGIPHVQDSLTYLFQAQTLAQGALTAPAPQLPEFFEQEFLLVENARWFGKYPPGYPLLLAAGVLLQLPWLINPLLSALTIPLLYVLGADLHGRRTGIMVALLALLSPFFLIMSGSMMAHSAELLWITLFLLAWFRATGIGRRKVSSRHRWVLVAGLALGMAFLTRQLTAVAIAVPIIGATFAFRIGQETLTKRLKRTATLVVATVPFVLILLGYQWAVTGSPFDDPRLMFWEFDRPGFGLDIGQGHNFFTYDQVGDLQVLHWQSDPSQPPRAHSPQRGLFNTMKNWQQLEVHLFGWLPLFTLAFCWVLFMTGQAKGSDWMLLFAAAMLVGIHVLYWSDGIMYGPRYYYAALPALLILTVRGLQAMARWLGGRAGKIVVACLLVTLIVGNLIFYLPKAASELRGYNFVSGAKLAAVESALDGPAIVFVDSGPGDWWEYGSFFLGNSPWLGGEIIYARDKGDSQNARLLALHPHRPGYRLVDGQLIAVATGKRLLTSSMAPLQ